MRDGAGARVCKKMTRVGVRWDLYSGSRPRASGTTTICMCPVLALPPLFLNKSPALGQSNNFDCFMSSFAFVDDVHVLLWKEMCDRNQCLVPIRKKTVLWSGVNRASLRCGESGLCPRPFAVRRKVGERVGEQQNTAVPVKRATSHPQLCFIWLNTPDPKPSGSRATSPRQSPPRRLTVAPSKVPAKLGWRGAMRAGGRASGRESQAPAGDRRQTEP